MVLLLKEKQVRNVKYKKSFLTVSTHLWNGLSPELKVINITQLFKTKVKSELLQGKLNSPETRATQYSAWPIDNDLLTPNLIIPVKLI